MKPAAFIIAIACLCGCTRFKVAQEDRSNPLTNERIITTDIKATAWFSSAQTIAKLKATQTDKTQSFGTEGLTQQGATNTAAALNALARILEALRPAP